MSEQKSTLSVKVEVDTREAKESAKELTVAVNECVEAFEKLENVMDRFTFKSETLIQLDIVFNGRTLAKSIVEQTADSIQGRVIKGSEINEDN
ncbi:hypothetical protein [Bacillus cereus]|uniref:hypothetical protein n=1 Tax=Bacillus cereus TaxID=1396 RepID=UPI00187AE3DF|nr:hypothetical protein [Bacillus cereus]MBE7095427.1 hypothetical protein [Bacillus cereus]